MDSYLKKISNLRTGERNPSVTRSRSSTPQPASRNIVVNEQTEQPAQPEQQECKRAVSPKVMCRKVAYKNDIDEVKKGIEEAKMIAVTVRCQIEQIKNDLMSKLDDVQKNLEEIGKNKEDAEKYEKLKQKFDNFISSYNENEIAHSEILKTLEQEIKKNEERLSKVEEAF